jgi:hypothetical protein
MFRICGSSPYIQHSLVFFPRQNWAGGVFGAAHHCAEFVLVEIDPPFAHRVLDEQDRPWVFEPYK